MGKIYLNEEEYGGGGGGVDYSTTEQLSGRKWIDGRPTYVRSFFLAELAASGSYIFDSTMKPSVIDNAWLIAPISWKYHSTQDIINLNNRGANASNAFINTMLQENNGLMITGVNAGSYKFMNISFTLEYTKVADLP